MAALVALTANHARLLEDHIFEHGRVLGVYDQERGTILWEGPVGRVPQMDVPVVVEYLGSW